MSGLRKRHGETKLAKPPSVSKAQKHESLGSSSAAVIGEGGVCGTAGPQYRSDKSRKPRKTGFPLKMLRERPGY